MKISAETRFNIGDKVLLHEDLVVREYKIMTISVNASEDGEIRVSYRLYNEIAEEKRIDLFEGGEVNSSEMHIEEDMLVKLQPLLSPLMINKRMSEKNWRSVTESMLSNEVCWVCKDEEKKVTAEGMCYDCRMAWRS